MLHKPLTPIDDDTEEAPWMVMGMPQWDAVSAFHAALTAELGSRGHPLLVAAMLPIRYRPFSDDTVETLAPDVLVAPVPVYLRSSYDVEREGVPPAFVLEVISPESKHRDLEIKPARYARMGVQEYALFAPPTAEGHQLLYPALQGFRLDPTRSEYVQWEPDESGRLYSEVLDLWLVARGRDLRLQRPDESWVPTQDDERQARMQAEAEQRRLAAEVARLRAELEERG
jgi:hypothetical protein